MSIEHINNLESGISVRGKLNDTIDQVNTNTTNIATNTTNISTKQDQRARNTTIYRIVEQTTGYVLAATDYNTWFIINNGADTTFTVPAALALIAGDSVKISNRSDSAGSVIITAGGGVTIRPAASLTVAAGNTVQLLKVSANVFILD